MGVLVALDRRDGLIVAWAYFADHDALLLSVRVDDRVRPRRHG
jgi:hypothetical protein